AQRPQREHPVELGAGDRQAPGPGPGREQERVISERLTAAEDDLPGAGCDGRHRPAADELDVVLLVERRIVDEDLLALGLAAQVVLRERRPLVGPDALLADQDDPA